MLIQIYLTYDNAGDITALNDNMRPDCLQNFGYDAVSRLTSACGSSVTYTQDYTYNAAHQLDNVVGKRLRRFTSDASGQVETGTRNGQVYIYINNNRDRPALVTKDGVTIANYIYDDDKQRIIKALPN